MLKEKKNVITITGDLASGKTTVTNLIAEQLGYSIHRNGAYARKIAKDLGMSVTQYNEYVEKHPEIDRQIENSAAEYVKNNDNVIVDARLGWYSVPDSFKVYLSVELEISAERALKDTDRKDTEKFVTLEEQKKDIQKRYKMENERFLKLYNIRRDDMSNYDLVLDTTKKTPQEIKDIIIQKYNEWLKK
ncbi:MAG: AAA family ATPase [Clostridia bacterium]|jgi:cytidylate kinase|uniref:(d)CMP kinase n=1 Tax=Romboutsia ilealis TaxID=1115758 RepID=UPI0026F3A664|nr:cytidylate kinase family protein [Romboutsia ilealis]MCI9015581.1 AAA family ATPase [Clostridia bacterium]